MPLPLLVLLVMGAATSNAAPVDPGVAFSVYDSPKLNRIMMRPFQERHIRRFRQDISDADYLYEHPVVFVLKQEGRDELVAFFADRGLNSLYSDENLRLVLEALRSGGGEKVGVLLDLRKHTPLPQWGMPITKFFLPVGFNLVRLARSSVSEAGALPWILVVDREDLRASDASQFERVAEFRVHDHYVKIPLQAEGYGKKTLIPAGSDLERYPLLGRISPELAPTPTPPGGDQEHIPPVIDRNAGILRNFPLFI